MGGGTSVEIIPNLKKANVDEFSFLTKKETSFILSYFVRVYFELESIKMQNFIGLPEVLMNMILKFSQPEYASKSYKLQ